jgi:predicted Fe-Mo cluster-binding NifX family protein
MRIAVPVDEGRLNPHFGQTRCFEIIDVDETSRTVTARRHVTVDGCSGCGALPGMLKEELVGTVICGGIGGGAMSNLQRLGLTVVAGAPVADAGEVVRAYLNGTLHTTEGVCNHGHEHGHGHAHGHGHGHSHGQRLADHTEH